MVDCRAPPGKHTFTISGEEEEVVRAATLDAVDVHGRKDTARVPQAESLHA